MLSTALEHVLQRYEAAMDEAFAGHSLANYLRNDLPNEVRSIIGPTDRYKVEGSPGKGNWTRCPWVAVFDVLVTESAQRGYYPVYLFREDLRGVYLSLNQGMTEVRERYGAAAKDVLKTRARQFRADLDTVPERFPEKEIDLKTSSSSSNSAYYEAGNICACYYRTGQMPTEEELVNDLHAVLEIYQILINLQDQPTDLEQREEDEQGLIIENLSVLRSHKRVERDRSIAKKVKEIHGYTCQVCGFNFEEVYGEIGKEYIEAHHLIPVAELRGKIVHRDPREDFAVLCSNCHRMIHRIDDPSNIAGLRGIIEGVDRIIVEAE